MIAFRALLLVMWLALFIYTGFTISNHGLTLLPIFFGDISKVIWPGQFNLDFSCFLILSALWTAWRTKFSSLGLTLGAIASVGGAGFLLPYLLILSFQTRGNIAAVMLGAHYNGYHNGGSQPSARPAS